MNVPLRFEPVEEHVPRMQRILASNPGGMLQLLCSVKLLLSPCRFEIQNAFDCLFCLCTCSLLKQTRL